MKRPLDWNRLSLVFVVLFFPGLYIANKIWPGETPEQFEQHRQEEFQRALKTLFELAGTPRVHAHLFRHTFATNLLLQGVPLETVSQLLRHASTAITERSYRHWVKGRQEKLEDAVRNSWAQLGTELTTEIQNR